MSKQIDKKLHRMRSAKQEYLEEKYWYRRPDNLMRRFWRKVASRARRRLDKLLSSE